MSATPVVHPGVLLFPVFHLEAFLALFKSRQGDMLTILAWVQAEGGSFQHCGILADVPDVKVYKDWDRGEGGHSKPSQHENVCQHDKLQGKTKNDRLLRMLLFELKLSQVWAAKNFGRKSHGVQTGQSD